MKKLFLILLVLLWIPVFAVGDGLAAIYVKQSGQSDKIYYAHRDHLDSVLSLTDSDGMAVFKANYDAWGKQTITTNTFKYHRGFTGHEHLPEFALINMNGRMYDPILGRFLSPDPYVQVPGFSQSFNRYSYAFNNSLVYTDPSGEIAWFVPVIVGIVSGVANLAANWDNVDGFWYGAATFVTGAEAGIATVYSGGSGLVALVSVGAGSGFITGGVNNIVTQTGTNFSRFSNVDWGQTMESSIIGGVAGSAGGVAGYWAATSSTLVNGISSPVLRSAVVSPLAAGTGHIAGGTTANLIAGQSFGEAFANSFEGIGQSMAIGTVIGMATTIGVSYASGISPWTGKTIEPKIEQNNNINKKISVQKQARHIAGTAKPGGGFLNNLEDAQTVLNAVHSGEATYLDTSSQGHLVYRFDGVTGTNVNIGAGISGQPTNVFMIKGTIHPTIVPTNPFWKAP
jgi:RHS repeat-associated protein